MPSCRLDLVHGGEHIFKTTPCSEILYEATRLTRHLVIRIANFGSCAWRVFRLIYRPRRLKIWMKFIYEYVTVHELKKKL